MSTSGGEESCDPVDDAKKDDVIDQTTHDQPNAEADKQESTMEEDKVDTAASDSEDSATDTGATDDGVAVSGNVADDVSDSASIDEEGTSAAEAANDGSERDSVSMNEESADSVATNDDTVGDSVSKDDGDTDSGAAGDADGGGDSDTASISKNEEAADGSGSDSASKGGEETGSAGDDSSAEDSTSNDEGATDSGAANDADNEDASEDVDQSLRKDAVDKASDDKSDTAKDDTNNNSLPVQDLDPHPFMCLDVSFLADNSDQGWASQLVSSLTLPSGLPPVEMDIIPGPYCNVTLRLNTALFPANLRDQWGMSIDHFELLISHIDKKHYRAIDFDPSVLPCVEVPADFDKFFVVHQIASFVRRELTGMYCLGAGMDEWMDPAETGSLFYHLLRALSTHMAGLTEYSVLCSGNLVSAFPQLSPEVLELLIVLLSRANESPLESRERKQAMRPDPLPSIRALRDDPQSSSAHPVNGRRKEEVVDGDIGRESAGEGRWNQQNTLDTFIASFPCVRRLLASDTEYNKFREDRRRAAGLIEWLMTSLPARIFAVPRPSMITEFNADFQFVVSDFSSRQIAFDAFRDTPTQTRLLFHGSPIRNWHSILRSGLQNYSGTEFQLSGAQHGNGIYLSDSLAESWAFATSRSTSDGHDGWPFDLAGEHVCGGGGGGCCAGKEPLASRAAAVVAVCEVVCAGMSAYSANIFTVPNADHVCVRMLLIYDNVSSAPSQVLLDDALSARVNQVLSNFAK